MVRLGLIAAVISAAACAGDDDPGAVPAQCHFASGRPCPPGVLCMAPQGDECNYVYCSVEPALVGTAVGCQADTVAPVAGGPFNCDPATVTLPQHSVTPPPAPCPLGGLYALDPARALPFVQCVPVAQCQPIACDPAFAGDGCPSAHRCDAETRTCVAN